jgi:hypothetical protein
LYISVSAGIGSSITHKCSAHLLFIWIFFIDLKLESAASNQSMLTFKWVPAFYIGFVIVLYDVLFNIAELESLYVHAGLSFAGLLFHLA